MSRKNVLAKGWMIFVAKTLQDTALKRPVRGMMKQAYDHVVCSGMCTCASFTMLDGPL